MVNDNFEDVGKEKMTKVIREYKRLAHMSVEVGALKANGERSSEMMEIIAMANEFGVHIQAKNAKYLTIPTKNAGKLKAKDIPGLFFYLTKQNHYPTLAVKDNGSVKIMFYLKKSVDIPERSFLRNAFDQNEVKSWVPRIEGDLEKIWDGDMSAHDLYDDLGRLMVRDVHKAIAKAEPGNAPLTIAHKGKDQPLVDTGALWRSIGWVVIDDA